ncbi:hypothetical protein [Streptomyces sp. 1222.5]|uniref:hypothetical protein n=1 Tax=Streptomyces sp. 1222.5 TaxID=1881026 RepID=UPI003EC0C8BB
MAAYARFVRGGVPASEIVRKLVITSGMNKGERPSVATVYDILAEEDVTHPTAEHPRLLLWLRPHGRASQVATLAETEIGVWGLHADRMEIQSEAVTA